MQRIPPNELIRIANWIKEEQFDVIHTHMSRAHFFGVLLRRLSGVPVVATAHTTHLQLHWPFNDLVIANSASTHDYQVKINRVNPAKILTIPCFVDLQRFTNTCSEVRTYVRRRLGILDNRPLIGVIGAVTQRKGQLELIDALPELIQQFPDLQVALIGEFHRRDKYTKQIRRSLFQKNLYRRVIWVGRRNNVHELVQGLDVCVVPSLKEPLGLCAMEAMAAGVPVAAAKVGGLCEFVIHGQTGMLFDPQNPAEMASAISRLITDQTLTDRLTVNAKRNVTENYSVDAITTQVENALESVVLTKQPPIASKAAA